MPIKVPRYEITRRPVSSLGAPMPRAMPGGAEESLWGTVGKIAKETLEYEDALKRAELAAELSTAKANLFNDLSSFEDSLLDRNDPGNYAEEYKERIRTAKEAYSETLSPETWQAFEPYFQFEAAKGRFRVSKVARGQQHVQLEANLNTTMDSYARNFSDKDPERRAAAWLLYRQAVNAARETKAIDPVKAQGYLADGYQLYQRGNAEAIVINELGFERGIAWLSGELILDDEKDQAILADLDEDTKRGLIRQFTSENNIIKAKTKEEQEKRDKDAQDYFLKKLDTIESMNTEEVLELRNEILASPDLKPTIGMGSKRAFLNAIDKLTEVSLKDEKPTTNYELYRNLTMQAYEGEITDPQVVLGLVGKGLTMENAKEIRNIIKQVADPAKKHEAELTKLAISSGSKMIIKGNLFTGFDAGEIRDAYLFEHALRKAIEAEPDPVKRANMLTPGTSEYAVDRVLSPYLKDPITRLRETADKIRGKTKPEKAEGERPKRKKRETIEEYLKRTGQR